MSTSENQTLKSSFVKLKLFITFVITSTTISWHIPSSHSLLKISYRLSVPHAKSRNYQLWNVWYVEVLADKLCLFNHLCQTIHFAAKQSHYFQKVKSTAIFTNTSHSYSDHTMIVLVHSQIVSPDSHTCTTVSLLRMILYKLTLQNIHLKRAAALNKHSYTKNDNE